MKKLLLLAAFGVAGLSSASQESKTFTSANFSYILDEGGFCTINIY